MPQIGKGFKACRRNPLSAIPSIFQVLLLSCEWSAVTHRNPKGEAFFADEITQKLRSRAVGYRVPFARGEPPSGGLVASPKVSLGKYSPRR
jgi:hypothetical protein